MFVRQRDSPSSSINRVTVHRCRSAPFAVTWPPQGNCVQPTLCVNTLRIFIVDRARRSSLHFLVSLCLGVAVFSRFLRPSLLPPYTTMLLLLHLPNAQDMLGRWSVIPVLAVGLCLWTKWKTRQDECRLEQSKLEEVRLWRLRANSRVTTPQEAAPVFRGPVFAWR